MTRHYGRFTGRHDREWTGIYENRIKTLVDALGRLHGEIASRFGSEDDMSPELREAMRIAVAVLDAHDARRAVINEQFQKSNVNPAPTGDRPPAPHRQLDTVAGLELHPVPRGNLLDTSPDLICCPFCGHLAGYRGPQHMGTFGMAYRAECSNTSCGVATPYHYRTRGDAGNAWNRRGATTKVKS